ncbi:hypothetical protein DPMN_116527 [Dreissena polymorpha]|uniref:Uncharacterized protein n=1 Tax=Dreissena polymorpha TaxID=45954 RepID=A0A9D4KN72_DREPO|nr:hypothetical protein DPMN_116527 [Dreissena polymorpha]
MCLFGSWVTTRDRASADRYVLSSLLMEKIHVSLALRKGVLIDLQKVPDRNNDTIYFNRNRIHGEWTGTQNVDHKVWLGSWGNMNVFLLCIVSMTAISGNLIEQIIQNNNAAETNTVAQLLTFKCDIGIEPA